MVNIGSIWGTGGHYWGQGGGAKGRVDVGGGDEARVFGVGRKVNGNFNSSTEISKVLEKAGPNIEKEEEKGNLRMG